MKAKKCRVCKKEFKPRYRATETACSLTCAKKHARETRIKKEKREWNIKKRKWKNKLKTHSQWLKDLQVVFNAYIRKRDKNKPCISCGSVTGKRDAGHYRSVGSTPELRFNEDNVHAQCVPCNQHKHGNLIDYRIGLIKRIGKEKVENLETAHPPLKLTIPEVKELIKLYKKKVKDEP